MVSVSCGNLYGMISSQNPYIPLKHPGGRNVTFGPIHNQCHYSQIVYLTILSSLTYIEWLFVRKQGDFIVEAVDSVAVLGCVELGAFAIADIEIAVALCLAMWNERTGFMRTDYLISRIFIFSVNRGIITVWDVILRSALYQKWLTIHKGSWIGWARHISSDFPIHGSIQSSLDSISLYE